MRKAILIYFVLSVVSINANAYDFKSGGLLFNIIDKTNKYVEITFDVDTINSYTNEILLIPEKISHNNEIYWVKRIGERAFMGCEKIQSVSLPRGLKNIGNSSFASCKNLTKIEIPGSVVSIDIFAFAICEKLESIVLPEELDSISEAIFAGCQNLKSVSIPKKVRHIGQKAFFLCRNLESISIPKNVTNLNGCTTFFGCTNLKQFAVQWSNPVEVHPLFANDFNVGNCTLIVPKGSKSKYEATETWKKFKTIIEN